MWITLQFKFPHSKTLRSRNQMQIFWYEYKTEGKNWTQKQYLISDCRCHMAIEDDSYYSMGSCLVDTSDAMSDTTVLKWTLLLLSNLYLLEIYSMRNNSTKSKEDQITQTIWISITIRIILPIGFFRCIHWLISKSILCQWLTPNNIQLKYDQEANDYFGIHFHLLIGSTINHNWTQTRFDSIAIVKRETENSIWKKNYFKINWIIILNFMRVLKCFYSVYLNLNSYVCVVRVFWESHYFSM